MWTTIITFVLGLASKWLGIGGSTSDTQAAQAAGEKQGQAEVTASVDQQELSREDKANKAGDDARRAGDVGVRAPDSAERPVDLGSEQ
jgi:hypothetical protein